MKIVFIFLTSLMFICFTTAANAQNFDSEFRNDVPSCARHYNIPELQKLHRQYLIIVDLTVKLSDEAKNDTLNRVRRSIRQGDRVQVISFSSTNEKELTLVQFDGRVDLQPTEDDYETKFPGNEVEQARTCFKNQIKLVQDKVLGILSSKLDVPIIDAKRSEILKSLGVATTQSLNDTAGTEKQVLIISDMIEHSDITSFYKDRSLRLIEPQKELAIVKNAKLTSDFKMANVYIAGAASVSEPKKNTVGIRERTALKEFWENWFKQSNANIKAWGEPALLENF